jgi:hypothetical protein
MTVVKRSLILGLMGLSVFYLISSGCAFFEFGGIKEKIRGTLDLPPDSVHKVFLSFFSSERSAELEIGMRNELIGHGYELVNNAGESDLEIQLTYKKITSKNRQLAILLFLPFYTSYDINGFNIKAVFKNSKSRSEKVYQAEYILSVRDILKDLDKQKPGAHDDAK